MKKSPEQECEIAITGWGMVAPGASHIESLWERVEAGQSPLHVLEFSPDAGCGSLAVCSVSESLGRTTRTKRLRREHRADRATRMALLAADRAWQDAGLQETPPVPGGVAVVVGTSRGPVEKWMESLHPRVSRQQTKRVLPSMAADSTFACLHGSITAMLGAEGPSYTVSAACSSGGHALALGADHLRSGSASVVVAGGVDAPLHEALLGQFLATGILDRHLPPDLVCRPFDRLACGTLIGEAAGFLVMETVASARKRGRPIHGLLRGWGLAADGEGTSAEAAGAQALQQAASVAMRRTCLHPADIAYLNAHGTGTRHNDELEMEWIRRLDRQRSSPLPFSSSKSVTGHCLGATPVLEAMLCLKALQLGRLPPTGNCPDPHPDAPDGLVLKAGQPLRGDFAMSNSLGFWGASSSLIFSLSL